MMARGKEERPKLPLKNGAIADVRSTMIVLGHLRAMLDFRPEEIHALRAVATGNAESASPDLVADLKKLRYVTTEGNVRQDVADVLESAWEIRDGGPVLVNPFRLTTDQDKAVADKLFDQANQDLIDFALGRSRRRPGRD